MIEQNAIGGVDSICLPIVSRKIETRHLADSVRRAGVKFRIFCLRNLFHPAEHFARTSEIESTFWDDILHRRQDEMSTVDVGVQRGKFIVKGVAYKALRGQMIAFIG